MHLLTQTPEAPNDPRQWQGRRIEVRRCGDGAVSIGGCGVPMRIEDLPIAEAWQVMAENRRRLQDEGVRFATDDDLRACGL